MAKSDGPVTDQEIRQPASLQHRHQHLRDARGPRHHGEERRGFRRLRRQDRRGHHPLGADPDHLRAGGQGGRRTCCRSPSCASSSASTATACRCWCRAISRSRSTRSRASRRSSASRWRRPSAAARSARSRSRCGATWRCSSAPSRCSRRSRAARGTAGEAAGEPEAAESGGGEIDELKRQLDEMQKRLDRLSDKDK